MAGIERFSGRLISCQTSSDSRVGKCNRSWLFLMMAFDKRRRFQFTLKNVLIALLIGSGIMAFGTHCVEGHVRQKSLLVLQENFCVVLYEGDGDIARYRFGEIHLTSPEKQKREGAVRTVVMDGNPYIYGNPDRSSLVFFRSAAGQFDSTISNEDVKVLGAFPEIETLVIVSDVVDDGMIPFLKKLRSLKRAVMYCPGLSQHGKEELQTTLPQCDIIYLKLSEKGNPFRELDVDLRQRR